MHSALFYMLRLHLPDGKYLVLAAPQKQLSGPYTWIQLPGPPRSDNNNLPPELLSELSKIVGSGDQVSLYYRAWWDYLRREKPSGRAKVKCKAIIWLDIYYWFPLERRNEVYTSIVLTKQYPITVHLENDAFVWEKNIHISRLLMYGHHEFVVFINVWNLIYDC